MALLTWLSCVRPHLPLQVRRRFRPRPREEALAAREDGEERNAQYGIGLQGAHGGCCKRVSSWYFTQYC